MTTHIANLIEKLQLKYNKDKPRVTLGTIGFNFLYTTSLGGLVFARRNYCNTIKENNPSETLIHVWGANETNWNLPTSNTIKGTGQVDCLKTQLPGVFGIVTTLYYTTPKDIDMLFTNSNDKLIEYNLIKTSIDDKIEDYKTKYTIKGLKDLNINYNSNSPPFPKSTSNPSPPQKLNRNQPKYVPIKKTLKSHPPNIVLPNTPSYDPMLNLLNETCADAKKNIKLLTLKINEEDEKLITLQKEKKNQSIKTNSLLINFNRYMKKLQKNREYASILIETLAPRISHHSKAKSRPVSQTFPDVPRHDPSLKLDYNNIALAKQNIKLLSLKIEQEQNTIKKLKTQKNNQSKNKLFLCKEFNRYVEELKTDGNFGHIFTETMAPSVPL